MRKQSRRVSIRLTPWQARQLDRLRHEGLVEGQEPRTVSEIFVKGLKQLAAGLMPEEDPDRTIDSTPNGPIER